MPMSTTSTTVLPGAVPPVEPVAVPWRYRTTLALVAFAMVLLPLIYVSIVALAAVGVVGYVAYVWPLVSATHGGGVLKVLAYGAVPLAGTVLVVFMVRSMWPSRRQALGGEPLAAEAEPELHAWVQGIAEALGAPVPREIRVDLEPNASAALRRGLLSLGSRDLTLTIGLPLAACFNARQLAGVVAHELGHFAQRGGMGVSYVIRAVNLWFARVVHERGSFDEELERKSAEGHWMVRTVAGLSRAFVWASRKVLAGLMWLGWGLSGAMSRQMELDADRYAARLVGARTSTETLTELGLVHAAAEQSWAEIQHLWRERQLPTDVLALVADHHHRLPPELVARLRASEEEPAASWYDTHPTDRARAASLEREPAEGIYRDERPAQALFHDFGEVCRRASIAAYCSWVGDQISKARLIDWLGVQARRESDERAEASLVRVFGPLQGPSRPLPLDLARGAERPLAEQPPAEEAPADLESRGVAAWDRLVRLEILALLDAARLEVPPEARREAVADHADGEAAILAARHDVETMESLLLAHDSGRARHVERSLARATAEERDEALRLAAALAVLDRSIPTARKVSDCLRAIQVLWPFAPANQRNAAFRDQMESRYQSLLAHLDTLRRTFKDQPNPLADHEHLSTLEWALFGTQPLSDDVVETVTLAEEALMRWRLLRRKLLGRLAEMTERVEAHTSALR